MLFKRKKPADEQDSANLISRMPRYNSVAHITINEFSGKALLRNISSGGFCMESKTYVALTPGDRYVMCLLPEMNSGVKPFEITVEVRWVKSTESKFSTGLAISEYSADRSFAKYLGYVKGRNAAVA
jgi:hypothetical protein